MAIAEKIKNAKANAIASAEIVYNYKLIAQAIGYSEDQLKNWRDDDTDFSDELERARSRFLQKRIKQARPEFLLERMEREIFSPPKQEHKVEHDFDPAKTLLEEYGITKEIENDRKNDEPIQSSPQSEA